MWTQGLVLYEGEDEAALKSRFVELSARYPDEDPFNITHLIFTENHMREPERHLAAAMEWSRDLAIKERIRLCRLNGGKEQSDISSKEQRLAEIEAIARNERIPAKERLQAYELIAKMQGEITKQIDATSNGKTLPSFPVPVYVRHSDLERAATQSTNS